jgi:flagellar hook-associated protein 2
MATVSGVLSSDQITTLIQQASTAYQAPANALQAQEKPIEAEISALGQVQSSLSGLQSALAALADVSSLPQRAVTTSAPGIATASVTNQAAAGTYALSGIHLAQSQSLISPGEGSASATLGSGSITLQIGSGSATTIAIASGQSSLDGIATAIDQANVGVTASVLYDGAAYHLVLSGDATGAANAFTVSGSGGLAGFSYGAGASGLSQTQAAADAGFSLNGIAISSGSNTITGVVPGLTVTLAASGSATVQVTSSVTSLDQTANTLVSALNGVLATINQYASYSPTSGGGPLFGDVGLQVLRSSLLDAIASPAAGAAGNTPYNSLGAVGFSITSGGTVALDDAAFQSAAQANYGAVASLVGGAAIASNSAIAVQGIGGAQPGTCAIDITANAAGGAISGTVNGEAASGSGGVLIVTGAGGAQGLALGIPSGLTGAAGTVTVSEGLYGSMGSVVNAALASGSGSITSEIAGYNASITSMNQQIAALQQQAQQQTLILTQQYSAAEATLTQLQTVSDFLNTYFNLPSGGG